MPSAGIAAEAVARAGRAVETATDLPRAEHVGPEPDDGCDRDLARLLFVADRRVRVLAIQEDEERARTHLAAPEVGDAGGVVQEDALAVARLGDVQIADHRVGGTDRRRADRAPLGDVRETSGDREHERDRDEASKHSVTSRPVPTNTTLVRQPSGRRSFDRPPGIFRPTRRGAFSGEARAAERQRGPPDRSPAGSARPAREPLRAARRRLVATSCRRSRASQPSSRSSRHTHI